MSFVENGTNHSTESSADDDDVRADHPHSHQGVILNVIVLNVIFNVILSIIRNISLVNDSGPAVPVLRSL